MKHAMMISLALGFLISLTQAHSVQAQTSQASDQMSELQQLRQELKAVKIELLQQEIDFQEWKIKQLERELQQVQSERQQLEKQERILTQRVTALHQQGAGDMGSETGVGEPNTVKDHSPEQEMKRFQTKQQPTIQREEELNGQLKQERDRLEDLRKRAKRLLPAEG